MKKMLFLIIFLATLISVNAQFSGGSGTSADPYQISTRTDLVAFAANSSSNGYKDAFYLQTNDIDLGGSGNPWTPLNISGFRGTFDGGNYSITNLYINSSSSGDFGLFTFINYCTIKNVNVSGDITLSNGSTFAGLLAGETGYNAIITNCSSSGSLTVNVSGNYYGGLIGYVQLSLTKISKSSSSVNVSSSGNSICGGFAGYVTQGPTIEECFATGSVNSGLYAGGFVGSALPSGLSTIIRNCYSTGNVSGGQPGSFIGGNTITVQNCYSTGSASKFMYYNGGTVSNSFYNSDNISFGTSGATGLSTAQMKIESNFTNAGWDFFGETTNGTNDYWNISSSVNDGYPGLSWQNYTYNYALSFDGIDDYIEIPNNSVLTPTNYVTVEVLAKSNTSTWNSTGMLVSKRDQFVLHPNETTKTIVFYINIGGSWYASSFDLTVDITEWHHYAGTYDGSNIKLFVDGTEVSSTPQTGSIYSGVTGSLYIGADIDFGGRFFNGQIDEVRIWDIARTQTQINDNKNIELNGNESGLIAYYKMSNGSGTTLSDNKKTGSPYDGTIYNGAVWTKIVDVANMPLPVEITSFTSNITENGIQLNWQTATETNNYGFEVLKSEFSSQNSEENWETIGFIQGHGTTNSPKNYEFTDYELPNSDQVNYRLKQIDNDGTFAYSKTITVDLSTINDVEKENVKYEFALEQNYPNPFNPTTSIEYQVASIEDVVLVVYNILGEKLATLVNEQKTPGIYKVVFDGSNFASGLYFYRIQAGNYNQVKKMLLLE